MGKTTLAVDIICTNLLKQVRRCYAACPTFHQQPALARLREAKGNPFPKRHIFTTVSDDVFEAIFIALNRVRAPTLLLVDDAAAEAATNKGNKGAFSRLCLAAPHLNLSIVGVFQRLTSASPAFRDNCEGIISFVPTKILDVDVIFKEFNPAPASMKSKNIVFNALSSAWQFSRFCFIWREKFTGHVFYFAGFDTRIEFNDDEQQYLYPDHSYDEPEISEY